MKSWGTLTLLAMSAILLMALAVWIAQGVRRNPLERERRRLLALNSNGRLGDAMITDIHDDTIFYSYTVRGVDYQTAQDVSNFSGQLPAETDRVIGPATMKYSIKNPANSMILCEDWSGLHIRNLRSA